MLRNIPLFGELFYARGGSISSSMSELFFSVLFSSLPIWFFPALGASVLAEAPSFEEGVAAVLSTGELFIYSSALVGPLIYSITKKYGSWAEENPSPSSSRLGKLSFEFPYGKWFFLISVGICVISALCFTLVRYSNLNIIQVSLDSGNLFNISIGMYIFSLVCLFAVVVYRNELESLSAGDLSSIDEFMKDWGQRDE